MRGNDAINPGGFSFICCRFILSRTRLIVRGCFVAFPTSHMGSSPSPPLPLNFPLFGGDAETQSSKDFPFMNIVVEPHASQIQMSALLVPFRYPSFFLGRQGRNCSREFHRLSIPLQLLQENIETSLMVTPDQFSNLVCLDFRVSSSNLWCGISVLLPHIPSHVFSDPEETCRDAASRPQRFQALVTWPPSA